MAEYGDAVLGFDAAGRVTVAHADNRIGVSAELLDQGGVLAEVDGVLVLDADGEYQYRRVGPSTVDARVIVFERVTDA